MKSESTKMLRYGMLIPLALMIAAFVSCGVSYSNARQYLTDDLNEAMFALANENRELWTRPDTVTALRHMHETTHKPLMYRASDVNFRNAALKEDAYFTLALTDQESMAPEMRGNKLASDSILLVPAGAVDGFAIEVRGFADCSMASVFAASDMTLPGFLFAFSLLSMASMLVWRRKEETVISLEGIKLTPMQRQFVQMLLDAPGRRVDKATLCSALWGNKSNAEESLYTLVRRTKTALAEADIEIVCNRGDSYELRVKS